MHAYTHTLFLVCRFRVAILQTGVLGALVGYHRPDMHTLLPTHTLARAHTGRGHHRPIGATASGGALPYSLLLSARLLLYFENRTSFPHHRHHLHRFLAHPCVCCWACGRERICVGVERWYTCLLVRPCAPSTLYACSDSAVLSQAENWCQCLPR